MPEDSKISKAQQKAVNKYVKNNYDRINVTFPKGEKEILKQHAAKQNESVNSFIVRSVKETMQHDNQVESVIDRSPKSEISTALNNSSSEKTADRDTEKLTEQAPNSAILSPDVLEEAQNAAAASGEAVPEFVSRAVKTQVKRDEASRRMGLDPVTGDRLKHEAPST